MSATPERYRFSVEEFHRMAAAGVFAEDDRVELLEGEVVEMTPIGSQHAGTVKWLNGWFQKHAGERVVVAVQDPLSLDPLSEPQPDLVLLRPRTDFYVRSHPTALDVYLVVEVCDTSCEHDRMVKAPLYSRAGVPELWIVDLTQKVLEAHTEPSARGYRQRRVVESGERLAPHALPDLILEVAELLEVGR